jgi:hypothetical protein
VAGAILFDSNTGKAEGLAPLKYSSGVDAGLPKSAEDQPDRSGRS